MKPIPLKPSFLLAVAVLALGVLTACENEDIPRTGIITFEDVVLDSTGVWNGSDKSGTLQKDDYGSDVYAGFFQSGPARFHNNFTDAVVYTYWSGMACSNHTDTETAGFMNQYSAAAGSGAAGSANFCLINSDNARYTFDQPRRVKSVYLTNSTYVYLAIKDGNDGAGFVRAFEEGDTFIVTITGLDNDGQVVGSVDSYLADYRNGHRSVVKNWTQFDLSPLGRVKSLVFTFSSTDVGDFGMNTPAYACMDNLIYVVED